MVFYVAAPHKLYLMYYSYAIAFFSGRYDAFRQMYKRQKSALFAIAEQKNALVKKEAYDSYVYCGATLHPRAIPHSNHIFGSGVIP